MRIADVRVFEVVGEGVPSWDPWEERSAHALDVYADPEPPGEPGEVEQHETVTVRHTYVEVLTDTGPTGIYGPIMGEQAWPIRRKLCPFLIGEDPLANERLWDRMLRLDRHGRSGYMMMAISAVDCALWDLKGKYYGVPVFHLLGWPSRDSVPAYASTLGYSVRPHRAAERALSFLEQGFTSQKWFFRWGPADGDDGVSSNILLVEALRDMVGDSAELMFDCFMGWDLPYAIQMAGLMMEYEPKWLEEPLMPDHLEGYRRLKEDTGIALAAGEHLYTRWGVKPYLDAGVLDYIQADPDWTGGITELMKICALAATYDAKVVPHGHNVAAALHVTAAQPPSLCPMLEYLLQHIPRQQFFHTEPIVPAKGVVALPRLPGLGIELDESKIDERREIE